MSETCPAKQCGRPARGGWCAGHRKRWERYGDAREDIPLRPRGDIAASFWPKVDRRADDECWPWLATVNRKGYGQVSRDGAIRPAHRVAYELLVGPIPEEMTLDHLCRNTGCVNPTHLEPVSAAENTRRQMQAVYPKKAKNEHADSE